MYRDRGSEYFYNDCSIPGAQMLEIVKNKEFWRLPPAMSEAAQEAYDVLLHTSDGQLCDVIVDRAALEAISEAGRTRRMRSSVIMQSLW